MISLIKLRAGQNNGDNKNNPIISVESLKCNANISIPSMSEFVSQIKRQIKTAQQTMRRIVLIQANYFQFISHKFL